MKYLKKFQTEADYEIFKNNGEYIIPNVSWIVENNTVKYSVSFILINADEQTYLGIDSNTYICI